jgi:hypothetical protein
MSAMSASMSIVTNKHVPFSIAMFSCVYVFKRGFLRLVERQLKILQRAFYVLAGFIELLLR